jgi:hypothetical protein
MTIEGNMDPMTGIVLGFLALMVVVVICNALVEIFQSLFKMVRSIIHGIVRVKVAKYRSVAPGEHR